MTHYCGWNAWEYAARIGVFTREMERVLARASRSYSGMRTSVSLNALAKMRRYDGASLREIASQLRSRFPAVAAATASVGGIYAAMKIAVTVPMFLPPPRRPCGAV